MNKRRLTVGEIAVGSVLPWDVYDEGGRLLLARGHVIVSSNQIDALIERGLFATADTRRDRDKAAPPAEEERPSAVALIMDARRRLQGVCGANAPKENFPEQVMRIRRLIQEACRQSRDAALAMILLARDDRYSIRHSVDAAVTCHVVGTVLAIQEPELSVIVAAALTMNISMLRLQDELQVNRNPLTAAQREAIAQHPQQSVEMLRQSGVTDETWIGAVLNHHEAMDGSGYPAHKKGDAIPSAARLVSMADVYCARVSGRDYRPSLRPNTALKALFLNQSGAMDKELAARFIKATGIYPSGTPVRLENGEMGVVTRQMDKANAPVVSALVGPRGVPFAVPIERDTSRQLYGVRDVVDWSEVGPIPSLRVLWGKDGVIS